MEQLRLCSSGIGTSILPQGNADAFPAQASGILPRGGAFRLFTEHHERIEV